MKKMMLFFSFLSLGLHFSVFAEEPVFVSETETGFRNIAVRWLEFEERAVKDPAAPEWIAVQLKKTREDFKAFAQENPESRWADDAYFLSAVLESDRVKSLKAKLYLIENYPESSAEEWTREALSFALPGLEPLDAGVRLDVCLEYLKSGMRRELEMLAIESADKYPELRSQFEILVLEPQVPKKNN